VDNLGLLNINFNYGEIMKFQKTVAIRYGTAEGSFQKGQFGVDEHGQHFRYVGKDELNGNNIWLLIEYFDSENAKQVEEFLKRAERVNRALKRKAVKTIMKPKFKRRLIQVDGRLVQNGGSVSDVARNAQIFAEKQANN
tara:strand:+ start:91 stop:507 length:417 start_codon:yes stop_codon:yes gene_type:complete